MYMTKKRLKRATALAMALVLMMGAVLPTAAYANATGADMDVHDTAVSQFQIRPVRFVIKQWLLPCLG